MADKVIKNNIKELRKKRGLTQQQLAEKIGISQVHLGRLESNARSMDLEQVEKIAAALGVKPFDILPQKWQPEEITPEEREILRMIKKQPHLKHQIIAIHLRKKTMQRILNNRYKFRLKQVQRNYSP